MVAWMREETKRARLTEEEKTTRLTEEEKTKRARLQMIYSETLPEIRNRVAESIYYISLNGEFFGTAVAVSRRHMLTCAHLLPSTPQKKTRGKKTASLPLNIMATRNFSGVSRCEYKVVQVCVDKVIDLLLLEISEADATAFPLEPLSIYQGDDPLGGENCVLVSYDHALTEQHQQKEPQLQIRSASVMSKIEDKFFYSAVSIRGNSGGAVMLKSSEILGMHIEAVTDEHSGRGCAVALTKSAIASFLRLNSVVT